MARNLLQLFTRSHEARVGMPSSFWMEITTPSLPLPSSLVTMRPVTSTRRATLASALDGLVSSPTLDRRRTQVMQALTDLTPGLKTLTDQRSQLVDIACPRSTICPKWPSTRSDHSH